MPRDLDKPRVKLYLADPDYYKTHLLKKLGKRNVDMATAYLDHDTTLKLVGKEFGVSQDRVRQVYTQFLRKVEGSAKWRKMTDMDKSMGKPKEEKVMDEEAKINYSGVTEEEYNTVKEMFFRGESIQEVMQEIKRSYVVIKTIRDAKDWADYKRLRYEFNNKYAYPKSTAQVSIPSPGEIKEFTPAQDNKYLGPLARAKEEFDRLQELFIAEEVRIRTMRHNFQDRMKERLQEL